MDTDKIIQDLNRRFAAPLPEFYQRRIIFWYDEDKEFEDKLDEVVLENAKVIALTGNNAFSVKKLLIFISHSSKNKDQVAKIADLLRSINLSPRRDIFCSSLPGYGIPNGANIFDFYADRSVRSSLTVLFVSFSGMSGFFLVSD